MRLCSLLQKDFHHQSLYHQIQPIQLPVIKRSSGPTAVSRFVLFVSKKSLVSNSDLNFSACAKSGRQNAEVFDTNGLKCRPSKYVRSTERYS